MPTIQFGNRRRYGRGSEPIMLQHRINKNSDVISSFAGEHNFHSSFGQNIDLPIDDNQSVLGAGEWRSWPVWLQGETEGHGLGIGYMIASSSHTDNKGRVTYTHKPFTVAVANVEPDTQKPWLDNVHLRGYSSSTRDFMKKLSRLMALVLIVLVAVNVVLMPIVDDYKIGGGDGLQIPLFVYPIAFVVLAFVVWSLWRSTRRTSLESEEFNRRFQLKSDDQKTDAIHLREFFSPAMQIAMLDRKFHPHVEFNNGFVIAYITEHLLQPQQITRLLEDTSLVVKRMDKELREDRAGKPIASQDTSTDEAIGVPRKPQQPATPNSGAGFNPPRARSVEEMMDARFGQKKSAAPNNDPNHDPRFGGGQ